MVYLAGKNFITSQLHASSNYLSYALPLVYPCLYTLMTYVYFTVRFGLPWVFSFWLLRELSSVLVARENSFTALRFEVLVEVLVSAL